VRTLATNKALTLSYTDLDGNTQPDERAAPEFEEEHEALYVECGAKGPVTVVCPSGWRAFIVTPVR
jgi:hypothetical protein